MAFLCTKALAELLYFLSHTLSCVNTIFAMTQMGYSSIKPDEKKRHEKM